MSRPERIARELALALARARAAREAGDPDCEAIMRADARRYRRALGV